MLREYFPRDRLITPTTDNGIFLTCILMFIEFPHRVMPPTPQTLDLPLLTLVLMLRLVLGQHILLTPPTPHLPHGTLLHMILQIPKPKLLHTNLTLPDLLLARIEMCLHIAGNCGDLAPGALHGSELAGLLVGGHLLTDGVVGAGGETAPDGLVGAG